MKKILGSIPGQAHKQTTILKLSLSTRYEYGLSKIDATIQDAN